MNIINNINWDIFLNNIELFSVPGWEWLRVRVFVYGQIFLIGLLIISILIINKTIKHSLNNKQLVASFYLTIFSYFIFVWYFIFFFLIGYLPHVYARYDVSIVMIPLVIIFFSSPVILIGSIIWFLVKYNKRIKEQQVIEYSENHFPIQVWSIIPLLLFGFIFIPIFSILYISTGLMLLYKMNDKPKMKIKIIAFVTIPISLLSLALLITGISIKLRSWHLIGELPYASYITIAIGFLLLLLSISLFLVYIKSFQAENKIVN